MARVFAGTAIAMLKIVETVEFDGALKCHFFNRETQHALFTVSYFICFTHGCGGRR